MLSEFNLKTEVLLDEVRANGRIPLIIGRQLTDKTREVLGLDPTDISEGQTKMIVQEKAIHWHKRWLERPVVLMV